MTNTGTTSITGDVGASPIAVGALTGFGLIPFADGTYSTSPFVVGRVYAADMLPPTPAYLNAAIADLLSAKLDAASRLNPSFVGLAAGNLNGLTLEAGLYKWASALTLTTSVTFDGCESDVWILQITGAVTVGAGASVVVTGGALAANIFWDIAGAVTVAAGAHIEGILMPTSITFGAGSSLNGAALVQTSITMSSNIIVKQSFDSCNPSSAPSTGPSLSSEPSTAPSFGPR